MNAKRWMALFLALTLAITMLAGCTKKTETPVADPEQGQTEQERKSRRPTSRRTSSSRCRSRS